MTGLALLVALSGCASLLGGPKIVEQQCGNVVGVGGCAVVVENPSDQTQSVTVTVEAVSSSGDVVGINSRTVSIGPNQQKEVVVGVSNLGGGVDGYKVSLN